jgi:hypothetical protein
MHIHLSVHAEQNTSFIPHGVRDDGWDFSATTVGPAPDIRPFNIVFLDTFLDIGLILNFSKPMNPLSENRDMFVRVYKGEVKRLGKCAASSKRTTTYLLIIHTSIYIFLSHSQRNIGYASFVYELFVGVNCRQLTYRWCGLHYSSDESRPGQCSNYMCHVK